MKTVLLDTNFLLIPGKHHVDIFEEIQRILYEQYELAVVAGTQEEIMKLAEKQDKDSRAASLALQLIKTKDIKTINAHKIFKEVDDFLIEVASKGNVIVATQDKELKKKLNCPIITLRGKDHLEVKENNHVLRD